LVFGKTKSCHNAAKELLTQYGTTNDNEKPIIKKVEISDLQQIKKESIRRKKYIDSSW